MQKLQGMQGSVWHKPHCGVQVQPRLLAASQVSQVSWARLSQRPGRKEFLHLASLQEIEALEHREHRYLFIQICSLVFVFTHFYLSKYNLVTLPWPPARPGPLSGAGAPRGRPPSRPPMSCRRSGRPSPGAESSPGFPHNCAHVPDLPCLSSED